MKYITLTIFLHKYQLNTERDKQRGRETEVQQPPDGMIHQRIDVAVEEGSIIKWAHAMRKQSPGIAKQRSERTNKAFSACSAGDLWRAKRRKEETCNFMKMMFSGEKLILDRMREGEPIGNVSQIRCT